MSSTIGVLGELAAERAKQNAKWGEQNHVLVDPVIAGQVDERGQWGVTRRMAEEYEIPTAARAKQRCQSPGGDPSSPDTWAHILVEEVCEFVEAGALCDVAAARAELVQVAAVAVAAIEAIDRAVSR